MTTTNNFTKANGYTLVNNKTGKTRQLSNAEVAYTTSCVVVATAILGLHLPGMIEKAVHKIKAKAKARKAKANEPDIVFIPDDPEMREFMEERSKKEKEGA